MDDKFMSLLADAEAFIQHYCDSNGIAFTAQNQIMQQTGREKQELSHLQLFDRVSLFWRRCVVSLTTKKKPNIRENEFKSAIRIIVERECEKAFEEFRTEFMSCKEDLLPLERFTFAMTGENNPLHIAVMAHWISNVKRNMLGLPIKDHILPVFRGPQGVGKSQGVLKLTAALKGLVRSIIRLDELADERNFASFSQHYICLCDEFSQSSRFSFKEFNSFFTSDKLTYRPLGSNSHKTVPMRCSFIGTTNEPLELQMVDPYGVRRFYEFICDKIDWKMINNLDYGGLWRGISEERDYLEGFRDELKAVQKPLEVPNPIKEFLQSYAIGPASTHEGIRILYKELYKHYANFCHNSGYESESKVWFARKLKSTGFINKLQRDGNDVSRYYYISADNSLGKDLKNTQHLSIVKHID